MKKKYGFYKMDLNEFKSWINSEPINRSVFFIQQHHTYRPDYSGFKGNNHFELQRNMKNHHVAHNGWSDIGQHFSIFPDGSLVTGRSLERSPACIYGKNSHSICIESIGNFDMGGDMMTDVHKNAIVAYTAALCIRLGIKPSVNTILYHHWFKLSSGERNNGRGGNKSCPGSNFFGGNKVEDFESNFLPHIQNAIGTDDAIIFDDFDKLVCVTASRLNVRKGPGTTFAKVSGIKPQKFGTILKTYSEENAWYKINTDGEHWVYGKYTKEVFKGEVRANALNVRSGPGTVNSVVDRFYKGQEVIVERVKNNWCKLNLEEKWVSKKYIRL